jgi:Ca-activated chloride channel family protein
MRSLSEQASGSFYFLEDPAAVKEVFHEEVTSFLVPLASRRLARRRHRRRVRAARHLRDQAVRGVGGPGHASTSRTCSWPTAPTSTTTRTADGAAAAGRSCSSCCASRAQAPTQASAASSCATASPTPTSYVDEKVAIQIPVAPGDVDLENGTFEHVSVEKGFVMLNIYMGFQMAATRASQGDYDGAWNVLDALDKNVDGWLAANPDFDIEDDLKYIRCSRPT